jgi:predicted dinucleotide-binding enzyme
MNVTIIGTGNMGRAIARRALAGGNEVTLVGRTREKAEEAAAELDGSVQVAETVEGGDLVILAMYWRDVPAAIEQYADGIAGKALAETTNPVTDDYSALLDLDAGSATAEIAKLVPDGTQVAKAFNTTFANTLTGGEVAGRPLDVFVAGDDGPKDAVRQLVEGGGMRCIDAGPLDHARHLESAGFVHMSVQGALDTGYASALKIVS